MPTASLHGVPLKGYTVFYRKFGSLYHPNELVSVQNQTDLLIKGLEKFTLYYLRVLAFTGKGNGLPSKEVGTSTDEDGMNTIEFLSILLKDGHFFFIGYCF